jgi:hypothetical protein
MTRFVQLLHEIWTLVYIDGHGRLTPHHLRRPSRDARAACASHLTLYLV